MKSDATTPEAYLAELPEDRRAIVSEMRDVLLQNLPDGFEETMGYGMLAYVVPHRLYDDGLLGWLESEWPKHSDRKLDMGKCCVRFRRAEHVPIALIAELATKMTPAEWIAHYEGVRR